MKTIIAALALLFSSVCAFAQFPSPARQECNLIVATVASTADWRDNGVPLSRSQRNVENVFLSSSVGPIMTIEDRQKWRDTVAGIYASDLTSGRLQRMLSQSYCKSP